MKRDNAALLFQRLLFPRLFKLQKSDTFKTRGSEMAVRIKPIQPTEIKDKKIARQVIEQIRKPIPAKVIKRNEKLVAYFKQFER
jgi:hypothetical protein